MLDRGIDALDERKVYVACEIERAGGPPKHEARLRHIHMQLLLDALAHAIDCRLDHRLDKARKRAQKLLLYRPRLSPILEADKARIRIDQLFVWTIEELNRLGLELFGSQTGRRGSLLDGEFRRRVLCSCRCGNRPRTDEKRKNPHTVHGLSLNCSANDYPRRS